MKQVPLVVLSMDGRDWPSSRVSNRGGMLKLFIERYVNQKTIIKALPIPECHRKARPSFMVRYCRFLSHSRFERNEVTAVNQCYTWTYRKQTQHESFIGVKRKKESFCPHVPYSHLWRKLYPHAQMRGLVAVVHEVSADWMARETRWTKETLCFDHTTKAAYWD